MKIFLTGGTGFVGSVLLPRLIQDPSVQQVRVLKLPGEEVPEYMQHPAVKVVDGDILEDRSLSAHMRGATHVVHLAGMISYKQRDALRLMDVNCRGVENVVKACRENRISRLIHVSSVGALGYAPDGREGDEETPFNWPSHFHYMITKYRGQQVVEKAMERGDISGVILNPASIMGPGDRNIKTPHNQLYERLYYKKIFGSFAGGLAVVDVRDLAEVIMKSLHKESFVHRKYLVTGHNVSYPDLLRLMGKISGRKVTPFPVPPFLIALVGRINEWIATLFRIEPLLTYSYGKISGMTGYYSNRRSREEFNHRYIPLEKTIEDSCRFFTRHFPR